MMLKTLSLPLNPLPLLLHLLLLEYESLSLPLWILQLMCADFGSSLDHLFDEMC